MRMAVRKEWALVLAIVAVVLFVGAFVLVFVPPFLVDCPAEGDVFCEADAYGRHQALILSMGLLSVVVLVGAGLLYLYAHRNPPSEPPPKVRGTSHGPSRGPSRRDPGPPATTPDGRRVVSTRRPPPR